MEKKFPGPVRLREKNAVFSIFKRRWFKRQNPSLRQKTSLHVCFMFVHLVSVQHQIEIKTIYMNFFLKWLGISCFYCFKGLLIRFWIIKRSLSSMNPKQRTILFAIFMLSLFHGIVIRFSWLKDPCPLWTWHNPFLPFPSSF